MNYSGMCKCSKWSIQVSTDLTLSQLSPRVCDCKYCKSHPLSAVISEPDMLIKLIGESSGLVLRKNGDQLANFYHCCKCEELLAVGCVINGQMRGAINSLLLDQKVFLGKTIKIQPRLLTGSQKMNRWDKLWGILKVCKLNLV